MREGAAAHIEQRLGHAMLWLACRHHVVELHIKHPYDTLQGARKGTISVMLL